GCPGGTFSADYQIWGRALGKPGGNVTMKTCGTDDTGAPVCSTGSALFTRGKGKSGFYDVTTSLTTVNACFDVAGVLTCETVSLLDRKSTRLNSSHVSISYAVFCLKKKKKNIR